MRVCAFLLALARKLASKKWVVVALLRGMTEKSCADDPHRKGGNVETELSQRLAKALRRCATHNQVLTYQRFHTLCEKGVPLAQRYAALESAVKTLGDVRDIDYGVLMALDSGLPGAEFFQRYLRHRHGEFVTLMGDPKYHRQTLARKRTLVARERERVYAHARMAAEERVEPGLAA